jgi:hypothetical protein
MLRRHLLKVAIVVGLLLTIAPLARADDVPDLTGEYKVEGTGPKGNYKGTATITKKGDTYHVKWEGTPTQVGVAVINGDLFSASFYDKGGAGAKEGGVGVYKIEKTDKGKIKLTGQWSWFPGDGKLYPETMIHAK